jgi:hypothetical protein
MEARIGVYRRRAFTVLALALIASGPWIGFWFLIPLATALIASLVAERLVRTRTHAHRWAAVGYAAKRGGRDRVCAAGARPLVVA